MVDSRGEPAWAWPDLHDAQRKVLLEVLINGSTSRAELARRTGLSRTSLTRLTRDLVELGFVTEGETSAPNGRGRPSEILNLEPGSAQFAGVKLTGEALYAVVTDLHANVIEIEDRPLVSRYVPDVVAQIAEIVGRFEAAHPRLASVGVCLAGDVEQVRGRSVVVGSHFLGWDDVPLESLVEAETGLPVAISNDVQALTAAHHWFGAGVGRSSLVLIGMGAGIGAGIVVNDELVRGTHGHPGKVGHSPLGQRPDVRSRPRGLCVRLRHDPRDPPQRGRHELRACPRAGRRRRRCGAECPRRCRICTRRRRRPAAELHRP